MFICYRNRIPFFCAKESKGVLVQAKHTRTASSHFSSRVDSALQQLTEQEMLINSASSQIPPEVGHVPCITICTFPQDTSKTKKNSEISFPLCLFVWLFFSLACP